ncbi:hypothetical protein PLA107_030805 (plasmid) [Pseudomonas amygdali pv. lachrymans str. M301315]|uniref:Transcriptional regulator n=2 Tax=Pseudomonas amygdali pv. lachrymans TaxID=53707 RepID=A0ABR5KQE6_PSEAV|nr:hypothetical protein PLA107_030805 [Pseudomonas amygdali pv. lachrymans str. M301315]KPC17046.1 Uncharacterized protein AC499_0248 [Pseudomonas amygdali pv. lachrymans]KPC18005.1 Uncharacterized protein AC499_1207 [Pseudomonas amygdali pv. lachrymans]RMT06318.1 hypothetical protein ALP54_102441 [Pseudomonas amygdali pv. lachrymans]
MTRLSSKNQGLTYLGPSSDYRTNRWRIECPACGHTFEPATTMLTAQHLMCPRAKCSVDLAIDYNAEKVILIT